MRLFPVECPLVSRWNLPVLPAGCPGGGRVGPGRAWERHGSSRAEGKGGNAMLGLELNSQSG